MNEAIIRVVDEIDRNFRCIEMNFRDDTWRNDIPSEAGWYLIKTDMPVDRLASVGGPLYKTRISIPDTINATLEMREMGITIIPNVDTEKYVVYNGEAKNLKARAKEHENGHPKTFCLGLSDYETLRDYRWEFCYATVSDGTFPHDKMVSSKLYRIAIEQAWRVKHGWPILSKK